MYTEIKNCTLNRREVIMDQEIDESISKEQLDMLFDKLGELPLIQLTRNDICLCGSGKKHKKCCLQKKKESSSTTELRMESFQIKSDPLTPEESKENFSPMPEEDEDTMSLLYHIFLKHPEKIDSENCDYFCQLNSLRIKHPDHPVILNRIGNGYQLLGLHEKLESLITETCEKFPDYLFALTAKANIYLKDGFPEKALSVLKGAYTLKTLYPHRDVFHITEFRAFEYFMVNYFYCTNQQSSAESHLNQMEKLLDEDDDLLQSARLIVKKMRGIHNFKASLSRFLK